MLATVGLAWRATVQCKARRCSTGGTYCAAMTVAVISQKITIPKPFLFHSLHLGSAVYPFSASLSSSNTFQSYQEKLLASTSPPPACFLFPAPVSTLSWLSHSGETHKHELSDSGWTQRTAQAPQSLHCTALRLRHPACLVPCETKTSDDIGGGSDIVRPLGAKQKERKNRQNINIRKFPPKPHALVEVPVVPRVLHVSTACVERLEID